MGWGNFAAGGGGGVPGDVEQHAAGVSGRFALIFYYLWPQYDVDIEFDPAKDEANIAKHGMSLARAAELDVLADVADGRFTEDRRRMYGLIDGLPFCLAYTLRGGMIRAISLRRAHLKEFRRYAR